MTKKMHLVSEIVPSEFDTDRLLYPRDTFDLVSVDLLRTFRLPYRKQITNAGKIAEYERNVYAVVITVRCKRCGTVKQIVDKSTIGCNEGPCNSNWVDLTGRRFGRLVAESYEFVPYRSGEPSKWYWRCRCDCGNECLKSSHSLLNSGTIECPGCSVSTKRFKVTLPNNGAAWNQAYRTTQHNAYKRDYAFELTMSQFQELCRRPCYYCGDEPSIPMRSGRSKEVVEYRNGIDRFDNTKGYVPDNCVPCCPACNVMKMSTAYNDWIDRIKRILEIHTKRSTTIPEGSTPKPVETDSSAAVVADKT